MSYTPEEKEQIARLTGWHLGTDRPAIMPAPEGTQYAGYWYDKDGREMAPAFTDALMNVQAFSVHDAEVIAYGYAPHSAYYDQPWHTTETLRQHCRDLSATLTEYSAKLGACDSIELVNATPQAFRIFGAIAHYLTLGYDADHIIAWLDAGAKVTEL